MLPTPVSSSLYPLLDLTPPYIAAEVGIHVPPSLLPASTLLCISRKQVIDVLSRLSREQVVIDGKVHGVREQIIEICLEYIGKRWRAGLGGVENVVEAIARKLTEIEFEVGRP
jgi:hypothetical protein